MLRDEQATYILGLRNAAERCIVLLGCGLLRNPANEDLVRRLQDQRLDVGEFYQQLRIQLLQVIAWMIGEQVGAVPQKSHSGATLYLERYSSEQLQAPNSGGLGGGVDSTWRRLQRVMRALFASDESIGVEAWGSQLFDPDHISDICDSELSDGDACALLETASSRLVVIVAVRRSAGDSCTQVLGTIHEWLLEQQLAVNFQSRSVSLLVREGHQRRATGSYFTPQALVQHLLDVCLEPVLRSCVDGESPDVTVQRLLQLRIVDPACGTGGFLLAAAHRLARRVDEIQGQCLPSSEVVGRRSLHAVVSQCIYGVDIGNIAVELCRLVLWFECGHPYEPMAILEQHIKCGNSIFGVEPGFETRPISDSVFDLVPGDDAEHARSLKRRNRSECRNSKMLEAARLDNTQAAEVPETPRDAGLTRFLADLWCAAYVWPKAAHVVFPTQSDFEKASDDVRAAQSRWQPALSEIASRYQFFHWHLQFADVFSGQTTRWGGDFRSMGGFDFVIGNPPWVAHAGRSTQNLHQGLKHFLRENYASFAGYPTTHGVFVELAARVLKPGGRIGFILPASVADLDGYAPTRNAHDEHCALIAPLPDYGEGQFTGVTQPCIALVSQKCDPGRQVADRGKPWELERSDMDAEGLALLERLGSCQRLPHEMFGERGFQSTPALRKFISRLDEPKSPFDVPLREGADVREFCLGDAQHFANSCLLKSGLRPLGEFAKVSVLVRQTARYPIAARSDGIAFRNSLLAVLHHSDWPWSALLCILNSALIRWNHYFRFRDGRQPILPQLKVGHLRAIPAPVSRNTQAFGILETMGAELAVRNRGIQDAERARIDDCVREVYDLSAGEHRMVTDWHTRRPR